MLFQSDTPTDGYLAGQLLVAMPGSQDPRFLRSVIYVCVHNQDGAMGLVLNRPAMGISFRELLKQLDIDAPAPRDIRIHAGGPVESSRGFVLHSLDYRQDMTMGTSEGIGLTATVDILKSLAKGEGPSRALLTLGYAGWGPGQLDQELVQNAWLTVPADEKLVFDVDLGRKWDQALKKLGVSVEMLSAEAGHA